jgi:hypothetical protein
MTIMRGNMKGTTKFFIIGEWSVDRDAFSSFQPFDTLAEAQAAAEQGAHRLQSDVLIYRAVRRVSPKREVTITDLVDDS